MVKRYELGEERGGNYGPARSRPWLIDSTRAGPGLPPLPLHVRADSRKKREAVNGRYVDNGKV